MSVETGLLIVVLVSVVLTPLWCIVPRAALRFLLATLWPLGVALWVYWRPDLPRSRAYDGEWRAWAPLFILMWFVPAMIVSLVATHLLWSRLLQKRSDAEKPTI